jgi:glycosyltransferase involved in cell wall biosynthesis
MSEAARELVARGHQVEVFTTDAYEARQRVPRPRLATEDGVVVHRFPNVSNRAAHRVTRFSPVGMRRALRTVAADVIHLSEVRHELAVLTWNAARRRGIPLVVSAHGTLPTGAGAKGAVKAQYDRRWVTPMLRAAAALLAQTTHEARAYAAFGVSPERIHVLPLGTSPPPPGEPTPLDLQGRGPVVLFLGRLHHLKGVDRLLRGFAEARLDGNPVLILAGRDDGAEASLRELAASLGLDEATRFVGPVYGDDRFALYRRADLFALTPNHFEETSLAAIEAASVGTALLLGDEAEAPYLDEYQAGWRVPPGAPPGPVLEKALAADLRRTGANAQQMVVERHLWSAVGARMEAILLDAAG